MITVIINEQHSILPQQDSLIKETFGGYTTLKVPASGWKLDEIRKLAKQIKSDKEKYLFLSPIPALMALMGTKRFYVLHNDKRDKKELPNGKIIFTPAKDGWKIV